MILNETTIPVNESLLREVEKIYFSLFSAYQRVAAGIEGTSKWDQYLQDKGGAEYLDKLFNRSMNSIFMPNEPLGEMINLETDKILSRKFKMKGLAFRDFLDNNPDAQITLTFWINNQKFEKSKKAKGSFTPLVQTVDNPPLKNVIQIRFPAPGPESRMPGLWRDMKVTIRHELQHFTQYFYAKLLGSKKWIGLPPPKSIKGRDLYSQTGHHQDVPVEVATDVQDEIDGFINDIKKIGGMDSKMLRNEIFDFVGIGRPEVASSIFRHYFETNKEIWKWAVSKLLSAVKAL